MNYDRLLAELIKRINFSKYDAFSTSKYCSYFEYKGKELALVWEHIDYEPRLTRDYEDVLKLKDKLEEAKKDGARVPAILSTVKTGEYLFQLQERAHGIKFGFYETLADKTPVSEFVEFLRTIDILNKHGISIDQGNNCLVDEDGTINLFDCINSKVQDKKVNSKPYTFKQYLLKEPEYLSEEDIKKLIIILRKWIKACIIYFSENNLENIREERYSTIKDYAFISTEEKYQLIDEELALQKGK